MEVVLAKIILRNPTVNNALYLNTIAYNQALEAMANRRILNGDNLVLVDMESALTVPADLIDTLHPNDSGYDKMADEWYATLSTVLTVSTTPSERFIPQAAWRLLFVDSEETVGSDGAAENAFDGNPATIWHSTWFTRVAPIPHEIQIDLGTEYVLSGLRYLPRQDIANGRIARYRFFVSQDGVNWGSPVAQGTFPNTVALQTVAWPETVGRFVRLVADSEVRGFDITSVAELNLVGY